MYKKCENCYKDGKTPNEESCKKCEDGLKAKEQECEKLKQALTEIKEILLINKRELEECLHNDIDGQIMKIISECEVEND